MDAEGDAAPSRAVAGDVFDLIDLDSDGTISYSELGRLVNRYRVSKSQRNLLQNGGGAKKMEPMSAEMEALSGFAAAPSRASVAAAEKRGAVAARASKRQTKPAGAPAASKSPARYVTPAMKAAAASASPATAADVVL